MEQTYYRRYCITALSSGGYRIDRDGVCLMHRVDTVAEAQRLIDMLCGSGTNLMGSDTNA